ncbi:MAG: TonB-dependent receptor [Pseudomonadales bacterium]|nr:TonB-dependent receptor [Pseudomonadales bacterium]
MTNYKLKIAISASLLVAAGAEVLAAESTMIEEVIVTALKRETNIQKTPISMTAITGGVIENAGITDVARLANFVPNMVVGQNNNDTLVMIRGIGTSDTSIVSDPSVAVHLDDLYIPRTSGLNMLMYDAGRVEILRGPQGTLYGRNATGGSVSIHSQHPESEFGLKADGLSGDYGWQQFRGVVNAPIIEDKLAARISLVKEERDGYQENIMPGGQDSNDLDASAWRVQFQWEATDNLSLFFKAEGVDYDGVGQQRERLESAAGYAGNAFQGTQADPAELNKVYKNTEEELDLESDTQLFRAKYLIEDVVDVTFIAGRSETEWSFVLDADQQSLPLQTVGYSSMVSEMDSQELRFTSATDGDLEWLVGFYRMTEQSSQPLLVVNSGLPFQTTINNGWAMDTESLAMYSHFTYAMNDEFNLQFGARYSEDEKKGEGRHAVCFTDIIRAPFPPQCPTPNEIIKAENTWSQDTWHLGIDWSPSIDHMVFAKVSTGYKAGGFNLISSSTENKTWDPEEVIAFEAGWKGNLMDGRLRLGTSAFHYAYDELQVAGIVDFSRLTFNAAEASISGLELEAVFQPTDGWMITGSLGWLDAEFDDFVAVDPVTVPQGNPLGAPPPVEEDFSGNKLINSPELSANLSVQYTFNLEGAGSLIARVQGHWQDEWYLRPYNLPEDRQDAYSTADVKLIWNSPEERYYVEAFVNNVTDEVHATSIEVTNGGYFGNVTAPRMWAVRVGFNY